MNYRVWVVELVGLVLSTGLILVFFGLILRAAPVWWAVS